jgi:type II secretory pathway component GspD/PulD (secretin)
MAIQHPRSLAASVLAMLGAVSCSSPGTTEAKKPDTAAGAPKSQPSAPQGQEPTLDQQRRAVLVAKFLEDARQLRGENKLDAALLLLAKAKDLEPGNQEVLRFIDAINAELGRPAGTAVTFAEEQQRLLQVNEERRRSQVLAHLQDAKNAMNSANYNRAIDELRLAELDIEYSPEQDWKDLPKQVTDLKAEAEKKQEAQVRREQTELNEKLAASLREQNVAVQARRRASVDALLHEAEIAYTSHNFQFAQDLSLKALNEEPNNAVALELHNAAVKAVRDDAGRQYYDAKGRELRAMLEAMEEVKDPQTDVLRIDPTTWNRALRRVQAGVAAAPIDPEDQRIWDRVKVEQVGRLSYTAENGQYPDVVRNLSGITNIPIIITPEGRAAITEDNLVMEIELVNSISLENFLNHMVGRSQKLGWTVKDGVVIITSKALAGGANVISTYDVRDLVFKRTQFLPPRIRDIPGEAGASDEPRTGHEADEKVSFVEMDQLVTTLKEGTDPAYWAATDSGVEITPEDQGYLAVKASPAMHAKLSTVMNDMRRFATPVVTIDSKFLLITRNFLQEVGVDFRGLGGSGNKGDTVSLDDVTNGLNNNASRGFDNGGTGDPAANPLSGAFYNDGGDGDVRARSENFFTTGLGNALTPNGGLTAGWTYINDIQFSMILRAIEKQEDAEVVNSQILTVVNNERGHVAVINQTAYVRDFDVEVAQASFIADPKVDVIQDGIVLDVQPIIKYDRKYITMQLQPTVAELQRPIPTFTTSLAGSTLPVTMQLPNLTVTSFATTVTVPDGGTVLLGGLRQMLNKERRAEIPLLGKLPLISILFKQEGTVDESRSLMVMVSARITDVRDTVAAGK